MNDKAQAELERIYERDGLLLPEAVVREASEPSNPLHTHFTWDDTEAARQWRYAEARGLIRKARVVLIKGPDTVEHVRAYVSVEHGGSRGYLPITRALEEHSDQVMERALVELEGMRVRYQNLIDFNEALRQALQAA